MFCAGSGPTNKRNRGQELVTKKLVLEPVRFIKLGYKQSNSVECSATATASFLSRCNGNISSSLTSHYQGRPAQLE